MWPSCCYPCHWYHGRCSQSIPPASERLWASGSEVCCEECQWFGERSTERVNEKKPCGPREVVTTWPQWSKCRARRIQESIKTRKNIRNICLSIHWWLLMYNGHVSRVGKVTSHTKNVESRSKEHVLLAMKLSAWLSLAHECEWNGFPAPKNTFLWLIKRAWWCIVL